MRFSIQTSSCNDPFDNGSSNVTQFQQQLYEELKDYQNRIAPKAFQIYLQMPPFDFSQYSIKDGTKVIKKPAKEYSSGEVYIGEWFGGQGYGRGIYIWKEGHFYEGFWLKSKKEGIGRYIWNHGETYEGEWKNDMRHGKGINIWPDGSKFEGYFKSNKKHGQGIFITKDGKINSGSWENGKLIQLNTVQNGKMHRKMKNCISNTKNECKSFLCNIF